MGTQGIWHRHRSSFLWVLGFVVVVWAALALTGPRAASDGAPATPARTGAQVTCPPSAPNPAAGCLTVTTP